MRSLIPSFVAGMLLACTLARAQSNLVLLLSPPSDYIGAGQTYYTTNQPGISGTMAAVQVVAFGFRMDFDAPGESNLEVRRYTNAVSHSTDGSLPVLKIAGNGRSCLATGCGDFEIKEIQADGTGQAAHFWATFSYQCHCGEATLTGDIRYNSLLAPPIPASRTLRVPADFPTIQAALDSMDTLAVDTVLVDPGVYTESVSFGGKRGRLVSAGGPSTTIITSPPGSVAVPFTGETPDSVLSGFTVKNSSTAIYISHGGSPTIVSNIIVNCGNGIICNYGSPIIRKNEIIACSGGAIALVFTGTPLVEGNLIEDNAGGIAMGSAGAPVIRNNIIRRNRGDGIGMGNYSDPDIIQNVITENAGHGISWLVPGGRRGPWVVNNTIVNNGGAGIAADGYDGGSRIINNIVVGNPALWVGDFNDVSAPIIEFNDFYSAASNVYSGLITNLTGIAGNVSIDPFLVCQPGDDYHLLSESGCIDAGTNLTALLPTIDLDGRERILIGHTNGPAVVDLGAFEFDLSNLPDPCLFLYCPSNMVVIAAAGQGSSVVNYPNPFTTPGASVTGSPPSGSVFPAGDNAVGVTAAYGTNVLNCSFTISVLTTVDFDRALNTADLDWIPRGDTGWFVQNAVTHDGPAAAQSGAITNNQSSILQTAFLGPGLLSFWWKVSSEVNRDFLYIMVGGDTNATTSGLVNWHQRTVYLGSGTNIVRWVYAKDSTGSQGQDAGWLDLVSYTLGATPPIITLQPTNRAQASGLDTTFVVAAVGTPPLSYQWKFNGTNIDGETNSFLVLTNIQASIIGNYVVAVTNLAGSTNSATAALSLAEVVAWGANTFGQANVPLDLTNVLGVAGGWHHSTALKSDGTVVVWGHNDRSQAEVPQGLTNVVAVSSKSGDHVLALRADGTIVAWGDNSYGQTNVPAGLSNVVAIAAGDVGNLALKVDGTVTAWGQVIVPAGLSNMVAIAAGGFHNLGLRADGTVVAWGDNTFGQTNVPSGSSNIVAIAAGYIHSLSLNADGTATAWGKYYTGSASVTARVPPSLINKVAAITAGSDHDLGLVGSGAPILKVPMSDPTWNGNHFAVSLPTHSGHVYVLEYKDSPVDANWIPLPLVAGTGGMQTLIDTTASGAQRFYRVRRW
jgi:parallel beta-helix repeat protein